MNKDVQVIVIDKRIPHPDLLLWLEQFKHVRFASKADAGTFDSLDLITCKRNSEIKWFLNETKLPWLLMLDDDIIPLDGLADCPDTWPLIESDKDVTSARFVAKAGNEAHGQKGSVAMAAVKISRIALKKMKPPWTHFIFNEDETQKVGCECDYFAAKARDAGFFPAKAGAVGHLGTCVLIPGRDRKSTRLNSSH